MHSRNKIHWLLYFQKTVKEFEIYFFSVNSVKYDTSRGLIKVVCIVKSLSFRMHYKHLCTPLLCDSKIIITIMFKSQCHPCGWKPEPENDSLLEDLNEKLTFDAKNAQIFTGSHSGKKNYFLLEIFFKVSLIYSQKSVTNRYNNFATSLII